jgi:pimeloyl-ACP methyl ester carboxylesterase
MLSARLAPMAALSGEALEKTTRDIAARGARIRFAEAGAGKPLLLVHDYLSSRLAWDDVIDDLARVFHVIAPDLPGFGESEKPPPGRFAYGFHAFSESLVDLVAGLGLARVSVCGHGLGGAIALTMAANHPHVVDKLILVNSLLYPTRKDTLSRIATIPVVGSIAFKQMYGRTLFKSWLRGAIPAKRLDTHFDLFSGPAAREAAYATIVSMQDTRALMASVPRVTSPALVTCGRTAKSSPIDHGRRLARELKNARFEVFESGHSPAEECPAQFVETVSAFLRGKSRGGA